MQDEAGSLFDVGVPQLAGTNDDELLDSLGADGSGENLQATVTGGGSFKLLGCNLPSRYMQNASPRISYVQIIPQIEITACSTSGSPILRSSRICRHAPCYRSS